MTGMDTSYKTMVVRLPAAMADRIADKAESEGMSRQQLLAALVDLGLERSAVSSAAPGLLTASVTLKAIQSCDGENGWTIGTRLKDLMWKHLTALVGR